MSDQAIRLAESMAEGEPALQQVTGTVVELAIPASEFVLADTLEAVPDAEVACERVVESGYESVLPLVWMQGVEREAVEAALANDPSVESASLVTGADDRWLYQMQWDRPIEFLAGLVTDPRATIVDLGGPDPRWSLSLLYESRAALSASLDAHRTPDLSFELASIRHLDGERSQAPAPRSRAGGLTSQRTTALRVAYEHGISTVPRETCLAALDDELDVSRQTVSERLRRGYRELIAVTPRDRASVRDGRLATED
jgi:hypothetical protein